LTPFGNLFLWDFGGVSRPMFAAAVGEHQEQVSLLRLSRTAAIPIRHASQSYAFHKERCYMLYWCLCRLSWGCCRRRRYHHECVTALHACLQGGFASVSRTLWNMARSIFPLERTPHNF
jgi:hypothetical protein